jgi:hypothetical protein
MQRIPFSPPPNRSAAHAAKRRSHARARERGAVMFVVAMTLALLAAMGAYALNMASAEVRASGYLRQNTQTHYLSEWAVLGGAEALTLDAQHLGFAISANNLSVPGLSNNMRTGCPSIAAVPAAPTSSTVARSCLMFWSTDLTNTLYGSGSKFVPLTTCSAPINKPIEPYQSGGNLSLRGDMGLSTSPDFLLEFTDLTSLGPPSGQSSSPDQQKQCSYLVTVTGTGVTPTGAGAGTTAGAPTEGMETTRSRVIFGPAPCGY